MATQTAPGAWQLDETGPAAYEQELVTRFLDPLAADLVEATEVGSGDRVLDVACGTGIVARHAVERVGADGEVVGVDVNAGMLATARDLADESISWKEASTTDLPFPDDSFDVVLCQCGLQFFEDRSTALAEMLRVLKPGGRLGVSTCRSVDHQPGYRQLAECVGRHVGVEAGDIIRSPYAFGDPEELRGVVADAGFSDVRLHFAVFAGRFPSAEGFLRAESSSSPLGDIVERLDVDVRDALIEELTAALRPHTDDDGVIFPFEAVAVTATR